jgi:N-acetylmuramoyl-L-alanine amidase
MLLSLGDSGEEVRHLHQRLASAGFLSSPVDNWEVFGASTQEAVRTFQTDRGLTATGSCDDDTWAALLESWWDLGDRPLMLRSPNLRGDDVAELQRILSRLGFDCGRIDGIFGPLAARALSDFQFNAGIESDGVCQSDTVEYLRLLSRMTGDGPGIAAVRDSEEARLGQPLVGLRVAVGQFGGLDTVTEALCAAVRDHGAMLIELPVTDAADHWKTANLFAADVYVGFEVVDEPIQRVAYYAVPAFESAGGRSLAQLIERHLRDVLPGLRVEGLRLPILRETKMPAVLLSVGPNPLGPERSRRVADALFLALTTWAP